MRARERAREVAKNLVRAYEVGATMKDLDAVVSMWQQVAEQAINAAVEEEREACAKIADNLRDAFKVQAVEKAGRGNADQVIEEYAGATGTAELISRAIRARSESRNWSHEIQTDATFP